jgi:MFS family permease
MAFTGDLVGREKIANAVALQQLSMRSTQVIGPAVAGFLISLALVGLAGVYYVTTAMFALAVLTMVTLPPGNPQPRLKQQSPAADLLDGLRYVRRHANISLLIVTSFVVVALGFPFQGFLVAVAEDVFNKGSTGFGLLSSATAIGAIVATVLVATYADHPKAWVAQLVLALGMGAGLIILGLTPSFIVAAAFTMPFLGATMSGFQSLNASLVMTLTDREYQGRVQSLTGLAFSFSGLAALPVGALADVIGLMNAFVVLGIAMMVVVAALNTAGVVAGLRLRRLRPAEAAAETVAVPPGGSG